MTAHTLTVYVLAIALGILAAEVRAYALRTEHADCGQPCDLPSCLDGPWSAEAIDRAHRLSDGTAA